jgi:plastocyanin
MRKLLVLGVLVGLLGALAVASPALSKRKSVEVGDNYFVNESHHTVVVKKGDKVVWGWEGHHPHNITVVSGPVKFHSKTMTKGSFAKTFKKRGTYKIICTIHAPKMKMTLKVE